MLQVYFDETRVGKPPLYVLAGWVSDAKTWVSFMEEWDRILRMSPRIAYFKYDHARNLHGEFEGMTEARRDEKVGLLAQTILEHNLVGVCSMIYASTFEKFFKGKLFGDLKSPYVWLAYTAYARLLSHAHANGEVNKITTYFDDFPGQAEHVRKWWPDFIETIKDIEPEAEKLIARHPYFVDDKDQMPIQAADLHAGWRWEIETAALDGVSPPKTMWKSEISDRWRTMGTIINDDFAQRIVDRVGPFPGGASD
jgi:hypothetical protein